MFRPRYHISPRLLAAIKHAAVQVHELNKQHLADDVLGELEQESLALSVAAATSDGDPLSPAEARHLLMVRPQTTLAGERAALNYGQTLLALGNAPVAAFDLRLLLRIHYRLTGELLPEAQRGRLRRDAVQVSDPGSDEALGAEEGYWPPDPQFLPVLVRDLVDFVQEKQTTLDPLLMAGLFYRQMLLIRPFAGSNTLTTWLATRILLSPMGLKTLNLLAVENDFRRDRQDARPVRTLKGNYYTLAGALDFTPWLEQFAEGISAELAALDERQRRRRASPATVLRAHHQAILDHIDEHGFITDRQYARLTDRAKATRSLDFKKLMQLDLLVREGQGRGTFYRRKSDV